MDTNGLTARKISMNAKIKSFVKGRVEAGKSYAKIRSMLVDLDHAKDVTEAEKFLEECEVAKTTRKKGITASMHEWFLEEPRSAKDLEKWIAANGTPNTLRWIKEHDKVRALTETLHNRFAK